MTTYTEAIQAVLERQIKNNNEVQGELIHTYTNRWGNCLILVFVDGRWAYYYAETDYDGDRTICLQEDAPDEGDLESAGLITPEEHQAQLAVERKKRELEQRQSELAQLAKLQAKYYGPAARTEEEL